MYLAAGRYIRIFEFETQYLEPSQRACGAHRFARDKGVCAEIPGAKKPRGYWDRSPSRRRGKGGFRRGTTCSEQKGPTNLPASIRENTPSALSHRSSCVRGLRSC